jgi:hypothetical protein
MGAWELCREIFNHCWYRIVLISNIDNNEEIFTLQYTHLAFKIKE